MDNVDIAQRQQDIMLAHQLAKAKAQIQPLTAHNQTSDGDYECIDCGELVELPRVKLGLTLRCIGCQKVYEKKG
ncbi:TraR/DksA C4-type zinc finger protein [Psychrobacter raelei]|uniref:TraR/DksA C4-type zinc finger protein n=1 Tax=Psychrobacter raelei TaxID=2565531 RepID=A0AAT9PF26_9GAMM